jgi:hypothetical protein
VLVDAEDIVAFASGGAEEALGIRIGERLRRDPHLTVTQVPNANPFDAIYATIRVNTRAQAIATVTQTRVCTQAVVQG